MADTKISALASGAALAGTEEIPMVQSSSTLKTTPSAIRTYLTNAAQTWTRTQTITPAANTEAIIISSFSITGSNVAKLMDLAGTWNTSGVAGVIKINLTDTASDANSYFMEGQIAGVPKFTARKDGALSVWNTYSNTTNYERLLVRWNSNVLEIGTEKGTNGGTARTLALTTDGTVRWSINATGHLIAGADATYDIGASGASRPRNVFVSGNGTFGGAITSANISTGVVASGNVTVTGFANVSTTLTVAQATVLNGNVSVCNATATPAGGSTSARLLFGTTAGFGVYYGSGAPTVSAAQGSIYLRSDGSTTATRLYVNTNGTTGWTNLTAAA